MLASLLNIPKTPEEWSLWSLNNKLEVERIHQAIQTQKSINLVQYELDPIPFSNITEWLLRNQQAHEDFNSALGLQGVDLSDVDFNNPSQVQSWVYLNWQELVTAQKSLGI